MTGPSVGAGWGGDVVPTAPFKVGEAGEGAEDTSQYHPYGPPTHKHRELKAQQHFTLRFVLLASPSDAKLLPG